MSDSKIISCRIAPSVKALMQLKDVTREDAEQIRQAWKTINNRQEAREVVDKLLRTYGVEYLGRHKRTGNHIYYANAGDAYAGTVLFSGPRAYVSYWADLVEKNLIVEA